MRECLGTLSAASDLDLAIVVTGQALIERYGDVEREIADAGLELAHRIPAVLSGADHAEMATAFADEVRGFTELWSAKAPDLVLLLGDRSEMLAAAAVAYHLCLPIGHIHGGERSGTLDEGFRHAISKLATYHFVANEDAEERLVRMGEERSRIVRIGAPGLVEIERVPRRDRTWLAERFGFSKEQPIALLLFHPVVQEGHDMERQMATVLDALQANGFQVLVLRPNSDSGGAKIDRCISERERDGDLVALSHLCRADYLQCLSACDVLVGNSSSGIIESATLGTPCVNLGSRQDGRLRNGNVVDCPALELEAVSRALQAVVLLESPFCNLYGDGCADRRLLDAIRSLAKSPLSTQKANSY
jgi:UDP-hydrolysing UDP-N-acetyl-D-glucosamine 2-epimerase